jgi:DNA-binding winged helix-turn-helix (wHTH) protein/Tol biopolymer transport system component
MAYLHSSANIRIASRRFCGDVRIWRALYLRGWMASQARFLSRFRFGAFELDATSGELRKSGMPIKLRLQATQVLLLLAERPGHIVTREEIRDRLWSDNTFVDFERGINFCVNQIRAALGDDADRPRYVETLPRRGYRFIAPVTVELPKEPTLTVALPSATAELHRGASESSSATSTGPGILVVPSRPTRVSVALWNRKLPVVMGVVVILASVAVGFVTHKWLSHSKGPSLQNMQITKLTDSGAVADVAISPDGRYVIYAQSNGEKQGLRLRQIATRSDVQILPPENVSFHGLTFSPDNNYVYFVRTDPDNPFFKYLYVMPTLGGPVRKLFTDVDSPVSFSPDGRKFAYERCIPADNHIDVRIANSDGTSDALLATVQNSSCFMYQSGMSWSPDGRVLAIPLKHFGQPERWVLHIVSVKDGGAKELYSSPSGLGHPVWLPEGNALLLPHYDQAAHRSQLWTISYPNGEGRRLTNDLNDYDVPLDMTRNGDTLAVVASTGISNVWTLPHADPTIGRQITFGNLFMFDVAEAPDGRILSISGDGSLWVTNTDGNLHNIFAEVPDAGWLTPCTRYIVLTSFASGVVTLMRLDVDGSNPVKLAGGSLWSPSCSPDGKFVFYVTADSAQKIWRVPIDGGTPVQIALILGEGISGRMSVSPDGRFIAYPYNQYLDPARPAWHLAVIPVEGGPPVKTINVPGGFWGTRWSPQGKGLQYALTQNGTTNIWEQPLEGGDPKQVTKFTSGRIFDFNWTADGNQLLLTRGEITSDVILLSNIQ